MYVVTIQLVKTFFGQKLGKTAHGSFFIIICQETFAPSGRHLKACFAEAPLVVIFILINYFYY